MVTEELATRDPQDREAVELDGMLHGGHQLFNRREVSDAERHLLQPRGHHSICASAASEASAPEHLLILGQ